MTTLCLPSWPTLLGFAFASLALSITPGPGVLYIVARAVTQGRGAGLVSVAGVALGNLGNAIGASIGLAALFAVSSLAFAVVKIAGAAYLVWLGIKALRSAAPGAASPQLAAAPPRQLFRDALVVALLNPKTALFFAAFLPQFIDPVCPAAPQSIVLSAVFVAIAAGTDALYALAAAAAAPVLAVAGGRRGWGRYVTAAAYFSLAAFALASSARSGPKT